MRAIRSEDRKYIGSRKDRILIGTRQSVRCSLVLLAYLLTCLPAYLMSDYYCTWPYPITVSNQYKNITNPSCIPRAMEVVQQPVLHIEARVKSTGDGIIIRTDLV